MHIHPIIAIKMETTVVTDALGEQAAANATATNNTTGGDVIATVSNETKAYEECPLDKHGCYCCEDEYDGSIFNFTCRSDHHGRYCCGETCGEEDIHSSTSCFTSRDQLRQAVVEYTSSNITISNAAYQTYGNMSDWCVSPLDDMNAVFAHLPPSFNENLGKWDVSNVKNMSFMFDGAFSFTGDDLNQWDVSHVIDMRGMFADACCSFNANLFKWNTSSVLEMSQMFENAQIFNRDVSMWDISSVKNMDKMFLGAQAFNQDLCAWGRGSSGAFPYSAVTDIFRDTACKFEDSPVEANKGPFCASLCDLTSSSSMTHLASLSVALSLVISFLLK